MKQFLKIITGAALGTLIGNILYHCFDNVASCVSDGQELNCPDKVPGPDEFCFCENSTLEEAMRMQAAVVAEWERHRFCNGRISPDMLCPLPSRAPNHHWDDVLIKVMTDERMQNAILSGESYDYFQMITDGSIVGPTGTVLLKYSSSDAGSDFSPVLEHWDVEDALYQMLASMSTWSGIANGLFEEIFCEVIAPDC